MQQDGLRGQNPFPSVAEAGRLSAIPTTAGTSADVSQFVTISNRQRHVKIAIISKTTVLGVALIDPVATLTMGSYLTACTGMDAPCQRHRGVHLYGPFAAVLGKEGAI